jgi:hypothetical protein
VALAERSRELLDGLPRGWRRARLELTVEEPEDVDRAALILGPATPGRTGNRFVLNLYNGQERLGTRSEVAQRALKRLDDEGIRGRIRVVATDGDVEDSEAAAVEVAPPPRRKTESLAAAWRTILKTFPPDWSHAYAQVELDSSDYLERAALLLAPANPLRMNGLTDLRFRVARAVGYGVSAEMATRCLERLDKEGITGRVTVLRVVAEDRPVGTQGPVWRIGGRSL